jgi:hypothetical protein
MPAAQNSQQATAYGESDAVTTRARHAVKTALSLTLAYLVPMGMGWPQPETAAITVMLIAATGLLSDSLRKGVVRVLGTVAGAVIGLSLIAIFPQERMLYLLAASIAVSAIAYLYNAYQGDSTLFMLAAVVTLMVFNGGDAQGAFLYGVDRAVMTAFGVIVYTLVAATLWPVKAVDNTCHLARQVTDHYARCFSLLANPPGGEAEAADEQLAKLLASEEAFQAHYNAVKGSADRVAAYRGEWDAVVCCYEQLQATLLPALHQETARGVDFTRYIDNYPVLIEHLQAMFGQLQQQWDGRDTGRRHEPLAVDYRPGSLRDAPHLTVAAVAARADLLARLQSILEKLGGALDSMLLDRGDFVPELKPRGKPAFIWLDLENARTTVRMFLTFWLATSLWITLNVPAGFTFVALSCVLVLLVSYTPVTPKLLYILFSLGFLCALPAYIFLLPQLHHWLQLATFMFGYAFVGFYVFQGPVSLFFLLGLLTMGIRNTMSYNVDAILLLMVTFYLMCTLLVATTHFPFSSKPERLYRSLCRRFFSRSARQLEVASDFRRRPAPIPADDGSYLLSKLKAWGGRVDDRYFPDAAGDRIVRLNRCCELLHGQLQVLLMRRDEFAANRLIRQGRNPGDRPLLAELCRNLAQGKLDPGSMATIEQRLQSTRERLDALRDPQQLAQHDRAELAQFFVYINLQASLLNSLHQCREAMQAIDWQQFAQARF